MTELTMEQLIVAATLERHSQRLYKKSWTTIYAEWFAKGQGMKTPEMLDVFDAIKCEWIQYLGEGGESSISETMLQ